MAGDKVAVRRRYSEALKAEVMVACDAPGASVAKVAMAHGINANVVHRWRQLAREGGQATVPRPREFVAVAVAPQTAIPSLAGRGVEIELRRGPVTMKLTWPVSAAVDLAAWARELLR
jgi:transposase